ncbi:MAG: hypothetical protein ACSHYF_07355 [Verrucomicrobiaceae bacterium]
MKFFLPLVVLIGWSCKEAQVSEVSPEEPDLGVEIGGTISSVNTSWGFLVVELDQQSTFERNSKFLMTRDGESLGEVLVGDFDADRAIIEIVPGSAPFGMKPSAGDLVVLTERRLN